MQILFLGIVKIKYVFSRPFLIERVWKSLLELHEDHCILGLWRVSPPRAFCMCVQVSRPGHTERVRGKETRRDAFAPSLFYCCDHTRSALPRRRTQRGPVLGDAKKKNANADAFLVWPGLQLGSPISSVKGLTIVLWCLVVLHNIQPQKKTHVVWILLWDPGASRVLIRGQRCFDPSGPGPKIAQNRGFPLKIAWKVHDFEKNLGGKGGPPGPIWIRYWDQVSAYMSVATTSKSSLSSRFFIDPQRTSCRFYNECIPNKRSHFGKRYFYGYSKMKIEFIL